MNSPLRWSSILRTPTNQQILKPTNLGHQQPPNATTTSFQSCSEALSDPESAGNHILPQEASLTSPEQGSGSIWEVCHGLGNHK